MPNAHRGLRLQNCMGNSGDFVSLKAATTHPSPRHRGAEQMHSAAPAIVWESQSSQRTIAGRKLTHRNGIREVREDRVGGGGKSSCATPPHIPCSNPGRIAIFWASAVQISLQIQTSKGPTRGEKPPSWNLENGACSGIAWQHFNGDKMTRTSQQEPDSSSDCELSIREAHIALAMNAIQLPCGLLGRVTPQPR
ncbi:hypothetical protein BC628DRAFT_1026729 [Trametes gibbosa]|nr:hypothetical protein BC628DRAFT_1026729 [Trametes gibbosa]